MKLKSKDVQKQSLWLLVLFAVFFGVGISIISLAKVLEYLFESLENIFLRLPFDLRAFLEYFLL